MEPKRVFGKCFAALKRAGNRVRAFRADGQIRKGMTARAVTAPQLYTFSSTGTEQFNR